MQTSCDDFVSEILLFVVCHYNNFCTFNCSHRMVDRYINSSAIFEIVPFDYFVVVGATAVSITALVLIVLFFEFICNKCKKPLPRKTKKKDVYWNPDSQIETKSMV